MVTAAPLRVATMSNTITTPNTICWLPRVHQRVTRNNNPFRLLSDHNADVDGNEGHNDVFIEDIADDGHNNNVTDSENRGDDFADDLVADNKDKD